jgi:hypothetical protein
MKNIVVNLRFDWSEEKNKWLKQERGVSFEMVEEAFLIGQDVRFSEHHNKRLYPHQGELQLKLHDYVYCVPFVQRGDVLFLKTMFPSRIANKNFQE